VGIVPKYVFDVANQVWVPADKGSFTCDPTTGYYLSPKYVFDKVTAWYKILPPSAPLTANMLTAPNVVHTVLGDLTIGSKDYEVAKALGLLDPAGGFVVSGKQAAVGATSDANLTGTNQTWMDFTNLINVINTLQSNADSGDVGANKNTQVGSLTSGTASVIANIINLLASAWSWSNGNLNFFTQSFNNWTGDITLQPNADANGGGGALGNTNAMINNSNDLNVNSKTLGNIVNNVDINAQSGDVNANKNTGVGNVASGNAMAEVNIINLINSFITSGSSFFGILNFFGTFNGDILFPDGFLNGLVPSSAGVSANAGGPGSSTEASVNNTNNLTLNNTQFQGVNNNINANAQSGTAGAAANTSVGNVSTGAATNTSSLFNLANSSIFGDNAVLVIVNVLGHWVGKIMTLPGGTSQSALLTGNAQVTQNASGPDSSNTASITNTNNATINNTSVGTITNNVNLNAKSGDATATKNTGVGDVSTGNASTSSNVANLFNTALNVKHWFGVLVINVFGDWFGDVNEDTVAGEVTSTLAAQSVAAQQATPSSLPKVGLLALAGAVTPAAGTGLTTGAGSGNSTNVSGGDGSAQVLTAAAQTPAKVAAEAQTRDMTLLFGISAVIMLMAGALASLDSKLKRSRS
jgi:hypothetical protein